MIPIIHPVAITNYHDLKDDNDDLMSYNAVSKSLLSKKWHMAITEVSESTVDDHVFSDFMQHIEPILDVTRYQVFKILWNSQVTSSCSKSS